MAKQTVASADQPVDLQTQIIEQAIDRNLWFFRALKEDESDALAKIMMQFKKVQTLLAQRDQYSEERKKEEALKRRQDRRERKLNASLNASKQE